VPPAHRRGSGGHPLVVAPQWDRPGPVAGGSRHRTFGRSSRSERRGPGLGSSVGRVALCPFDPGRAHGRRHGAHRPPTRIPDSERVFVITVI
jgi:hypothetical protein